jgi:hypothetical protein
LTRRSRPTPENCPTLRGGIGARLRGDRPANWMTARAVIGARTRRACRRRQALGEAVNDAWRMLALLSLAGALAVLCPRPAKPQAQADFGSPTYLWPSAPSRVSGLIATLSVLWAVRRNCGPLPSAEPANPAPSHAHASARACGFIRADRQSARRGAGERHPFASSPEMVTTNSSAHFAREQDATSLQVCALTLAVAKLRLAPKNKLSPSTGQFRARHILPPGGC